MSSSEEYTIKLRPPTYASVEADTMVEAGREVWHSVGDLLADVEFNTNRGQVRIELDWTRVPEFDDGSLRPFSLKCTTRSEWKAEPDVEAARNPLPEIELWLHHIFLMMNLSAPGCCSLVGKIYHGESRKPVNEISVLADSLEYAWADSLIEKWPSISYVPLPEVRAWYFGNCSLGSQISTSPIERALFTILYAGVRDYTYSFLPVLIIGALESLFQVRVDEISSSLRRRILIVNPSSDASHIDKMLKILYTHRSKFVHGAAPLIHPMEHDFMDSSILKPMGEDMDASVRALSILIATTQNLVLNGASGIGFGESVEWLRRPNFA